MLESASILFVCSCSTLVVSYHVVIWWWYDMKKLATYDVKINLWCINCCQQISHMILHHTTVSSAPSSPHNSFISTIFITQQFHQQHLHHTTVSSAPSSSHNSFISTIFINMSHNNSVQQTKHYRNNYKLEGHSIGVHHSRRLFDRLTVSRCRPIG